LLTVSTMEADVEAKKVALASLEVPGARVFGGDVARVGDRKLWKRQPQSTDLPSRQALSLAARPHGKP